MALTYEGDALRPIGPAFVLHVTKVAVCAANTRCRSWHYANDPGLIDQASRVPIGFQRIQALSGAVMVRVNQAGRRLELYALTLFAFLYPIFGIPESDRTESNPRPYQRVR